MTSKLTKERLQEIAEDGFLKHGESKELARMALAAMDSEPVELPLDYLQGHKDGLEWASQLAKANHPETGDWLYDDPIELAKAIRKGPDMPPVQPVPVVDADDNFYSWFGREWAENYQHNQYTTAAKQMLGVMAESAWKAGRRAAMLAAAPQPALVVPPEQHWAELCHQHPDMSIGDAIIRAAWWNHCRAAMLQAGDKVRDLSTPVDPQVAEYEQNVMQAGNSPVIPDGYVMVPKEPTEAMMLHNSGCQHHAWDDPDCAMRQTRRLIWSHMLAAAPQEVKGE